MYPVVQRPIPGIDLSASVFTSAGPGPADGEAPELVGELVLGLAAIAFFVGGHRLVSRSSFASWIMKRYRQESRWSAQAGIG